MSYEELKEHLMTFFGDTSRSPSETREGLKGIIEEAEMLIETIPEGS